MTRGEAASRTADRGRLIARGRTAEVYGWGDGQVVKLLLPPFERLAQRELEISRLVADAYPGAPACGGLVEVDGRAGLLYERVDGPSMERILWRQPWRLDAMARTFASVTLGMHATDGRGLPDQRAAFHDAISRAASMHVVDAAVPAGAYAAAHVRVDELPVGASVCHGDLHPGNILLGSRPVVIDWENARGGSPAGDLARAILLTRDTPLGEPAQAVLAPLVRLLRRRFMAVALASYRARSSVADAEVDAWRLPVLVARLAEAITEERAWLAEAIQRELRLAA